MSEFTKNTDALSLIVAALTVITIIAQGYYLLSKSIKDITASYRISVLGLPRSGKTALIASIFDTLFSSHIPGGFSPAGEETISRVNKFIASLDAYNPIPPTKEADVFLFRFLLYVKRRIVGRVRYEGEVVDFPGELSKKLMDSAEDGSIDEDITLFHREFFSWVLSSKVHLFVVDIAALLTSPSRSSFVATTSAQIRATWQVLNEELASASFPDRKVALVFSKADLLNFFDLHRQLGSSEQEELTSLAFGNPPPPYAQGRTDVSLQKSADSLAIIFRELLAYFKGQKCEFKCFLVSAYRNGQGDRPGIRQLVEYLLPRGVVRGPFV